jgi:hypothetical protein
MFPSIPSATLENFMTFGDLLRFLRHSGLTQTELAIEVGYGHARFEVQQGLKRGQAVPVMIQRFHRHVINSGISFVRNRL